MMHRLPYIGLAVAGLALMVGMPARGIAAPGPVIAPADNVGLVQQVDYNNRRWRYRNGTHVRGPLTAVDDDRDGTFVRAPFARVYSGRRGTWVRAPFVNLWIPR
jgi:hypothetical protein